MDPFEEIDPEKIDTRIVKLPISRIKISNEVIKIIEYFFTNPDRINIPFRGFLFEGPPGNGKTELVKQIFKKIYNHYPNDEFKLILVDSANVAAAKWGDAEQNIKTIFKSNILSNKKTIILFDDIDCLMIKRGSNLATEWHYSINSVLFHELDNMDPSKTILIGTTNRSDLIDEALRSRLYYYNIPPYTKEELIDISENIIKMNRMKNPKAINEKVKDYLNKIEEKIKKGEMSNKERVTIRDVQHILTKIYIGEILNYGSN